MPWPMSILPKNAVTRPSGRIAIHESSSLGRRGGLPPMAAVVEMPWLIAVAMAPGMETLTTSEPEAFRKSRRVIGFMCPPYAVTLAARLIARMIAIWVPQRHLIPAIAWRIWASVGLGLFFRNAAAVMIQPERQ